ncbi:hypothetical protein SAMN04488550_2907 [Gordonia malaquae]|uniref:Uncharacterized protein n=1 Tax=Gordonia malaquae NBRC 108250 TaxID=1223542 RepID=M3VDW8_GORML|nr:hypothetical protein [Gordonia malaquae]GAC78779.1 hypothetical protein GM1_004_02240 [Gordonia malaquae NBRC 108250]SED65714.1 hypothetical protein SAMN04488550_2907 [Gordonia malaquae]
MSDHEEFEYVDEDGNPLSVEEIAALGDDIEIVEEVEDVEEVEAPAAQQPAAETPAVPADGGSRVPKALLGGVAALVLLVGGGAAYGMHALGQQNTAEDVAAAASSKVEEVQSSVEDKKEEVLEPEPSAAPEPVRTGARVTGAQCMDPAQARWDGEGEMPEFRLRRESAAELPSSITARVKKRHKDDPSELSIVQSERNRLGVYASDSAGIYSRAVISITGGVPVVLNSGATPRVGDDAGACPTLARATTYAVVDGDKEKPIEILASKSVGDVMYGITDDEIIELSLEKIEADQPEKVGAASSSAPSE